MQECGLKDWTRLFYSYFTLPAMQTGWQLYQTGCVLEYVLDPDEGFVDGNVSKPEGSLGFYEQPSFGFESFTDSECTCHKRSACEHIAALAFIYLEEELGLDSQQIFRPGGNAWGGSGGIFTGAQSAVLRQGERPASKAVSMKKAKAQTPGPSSSVEDWHRYFRHRFPPEKLSGSRAIETLYNTVYGGLAPSGSAWPPALKELYELHTLLFAMRLLDELSGAGYRYAYGYDYYTMQEALSLTFDQIYNRLVHVIRSMEPAEAWRLYPERLQETIAYLAVHAFPASSSFVPWMPVYISLWRGLLETEAAAEREIARLSRAVRQEGVSSGQHDQLLTARIMFDIDAGEDEAGLSRLQQFKLRGHGRIYPFLYAFQHAAQWARLQLWLERMAPIFVSQWGQPDRTYYEFWKTLLDKHPDMGKLREAWEKTMLELLPNSFPYYLDQLMAQERFREWVDLHMAFGYTPLELRVSDYKPIEQKQKHLLLPWFHHSVEKLIAEKNRVAYKQAVKLMKKLRTMYGKLKRIDRWELYLEHVSVKYSRLRALQEELKVLRKEGA